MNCEIRSVPLLPLKCCIPCLTPEPVSGFVSETDPAIAVMTDFNTVTPITIEPSADIETALQKMKDEGVRLLLITDENNSIAGIITSFDIQGEKAIRYAAQWGLKHDEILVVMIMTPLDQVPGLDFGFIQRALVRHIIVSMKEIGRQHALVIETDHDTGDQRIRGIYSTTHISKLLGKPVGGDSPLPAGSLVELNLVMSSRG